MFHFIHKWIHYPPTAIRCFEQRICKKCYKAQEFIPDCGAPSSGGGWENVLVAEFLETADKDADMKILRESAILPGDTFEGWYSRYSQANRLHSDPDHVKHFYDYRAYFLKATEFLPIIDRLDGTIHLTDKFKKEGHPSLEIADIEDSCDACRLRPGDQNVD